MAEAGGEPDRRTPRTERGRTGRAGRQLALAAVFEADFGLRTATAVLDRQLATGATSSASAALARDIVDAVVARRDEIDRLIERSAPQYPVVALARIDRALLRCALGEVLHSPTPARVAIAEWVELARTYSGDPMRRLINGVLGRISREAVAHDERDGRRPHPGPRDSARDGSPPTRR